MLFQVSELIFKRSYYQCEFSKSTLAPTSSCVKYWLKFDTNVLFQFKSFLAKFSKNFLLFPSTGVISVFFGTRFYAIEERYKLIQCDVQFTSCILLVYFRIISIYDQVEE